MRPAIDPGSGLEAYLDRLGIGTGPLVSSSIGGGHSNLTFLLERGPTKVVLRRPPHGKLAPSTHDVLREARLLEALREPPVEVPEVLATCDDLGVIGSPFYLMTYVDGHVLSETLPPSFRDPAAAAAIGREFIATLARLHSLDADHPSLAGFGRPDGYLERQIRRFRGLLEENATRPLPELERVADWLDLHRPQSSRHTLVHGDYRLGNVMFAADAPRLIAVLDWEMATLGDPLADLGYCTAAWAEPADEPNPILDLSRGTRGPGFPNRRELIAIYSEASGASVDSLAWYQVLAAWKAAIFLEGSYGRYLEGDSVDPYFAGLAEGVPALARQATRWAELAG